MIKKSTGAMDKKMSKVQHVWETTTDTGYLVLGNTTEDRSPYPYKVRWNRVQHRRGQILRRGTRFIEVDHKDYEYYGRGNGKSAITKETNISKERRSLLVNKRRSTDTRRT